MDVKTFDRSAYLAVTLLIVTACAMMTHYLTKTKELDFHQLSSSQIQLFDGEDKSGKSKASLSFPNGEDGPMVLTCEIQNYDNNAYLSRHFCKVTLIFNDGEQGLDFSNYDSFSLWIKYEKATMQGIRFQARNYNPFYSTLGESDSLKYNTVEFTNEINPYPIEVPFQSFQVPPWWLTSEKLSHKHGVPEFNNIHRIDIFTGFAMPPGTYRIVIERIAATGKWVNVDTVYVLLLVFWVLLGVMYLLSQLNIIDRIFKRNRLSADIAALKEFIYKSSLVRKSNVPIDPETGAADNQSVAALLYEFYLSKNNKDITLLIIECDKVEGLDDQQHELALRNCANIFKSNTRHSDTVARWSDHGFVIVLPFTDMAYASRLAEKLRRLVEEMEVDPVLTVSIGVATLDETKPKEVLKQANNAVKSAKYQGGNCVVSATPQLVDIQFASAG